MRFSRSRRAGSPPTLRSSSSRTGAGRGRAPACEEHRGPWSARIVRYATPVESARRSSANALPTWSTRRLSFQGKLDYAATQDEPEGGFDVTVVDFAAFLRDLSKPTRLIKVDIEGAEWAVLRPMIADALDRFEAIVVETDEPLRRRGLREAVQLQRFRGGAHGAVHQLVLE